MKRILSLVACFCSIVVLSSCSSGHIEIVEPSDIVYSAVYDTEETPPEIDELIGVGSVTYRDMKVKTISVPIYANPHKSSSVLKEQQYGVWYDEKVLICRGVTSKQSGVVVSMKNEISNPVVYVSYGDDSGGYKDEQVVIMTIEFDVVMLANCSVRLAGGEFGRRVGGIGEVSFYNCRM